MPEFTPALSRAARALLGWSANDLAQEAKVGVATVKRFELGGGARQSSLDAMQGAITGAGVLLIGDGEASPAGGAGVRLG